MKTPEQPNVTYFKVQYYTARRHIVITHIDSCFITGNPGLGMQLSLADFDSDDFIPGWLPPDKWEDLLAVSVLPGPLDSLCVQVSVGAVGGVGREIGVWRGVGVGIGCQSGGLRC